MGAMRGMHAVTTGAYEDDEPAGQSLFSGGQSAQCSSSKAE